MKRGFMKKNIFVLCCLAFILTGCNQDSQKTTNESVPLKPDVQNALDRLKQKESPSQQISSVTDVLKALSALESSLERYEMTFETCKSASLNDLDISVSLPGYNLSVDGTACTVIAQREDGEDAGTKFFKKKGSSSVYCSGGNGRLCEKATAQGVSKTCEVSLSVGGYKIGNIFTNNGFNGKSFKKQNVKAFTQYFAGDKWDDTGALTLLVDNSNQKIVYIEKQQGGTIATIIRAVEKQSGTSLQKITSMGIVFSGNGKICGKYDISVGTESGDYDYTANQGIVTIAVADGTRLQQLKQRLEDSAADGISL